MMQGWGSKEPLTQTNMAVLSHAAEVGLEPDFAMYKIS